MTNRRLTALGAVLLTVVLLVGCSEDPAIQMRYRAEKLFYDAEEAVQSVQLNPHQDTQNSYKLLTDQYRRALDYSYAALDSIAVDQNLQERNELSLIAFKAASRLTQLAFTAQHYDSGAMYAQELVNRVQLQGDAKLSAYLNLGQALQASGQWDSSLVVYQNSLDEFYPPLDSRGQPVENLLNLPAHIYGAYMKIGDTVSANSALGKAESYYGGLINGYPYLSFHR